jgi:hypothetical protein
LAVAVLVTALGLEGVCDTVQAAPDPLVTWRPNNSTTTESPTSVATNVGAVDLSRAGVVYYTGSTYNSRDWPQGGTIDTGYYLQWGVSPASGYRIELSALDIRYDRSGTGPAQIEIRVSTDDFATYTVVWMDNNVSDSSEEHAG